MILDKTGVITVPVNSPDKHRTGSDLFSVGLCHENKVTVAKVQQLLSVRHKTSAYVTDTKSRARQTLPPEMKTFVPVRFPQSNSFQQTMDLNI